MHEGGLGKLGALAFFSYCHFVIFLLFFLRDFFFFFVTNEKHVSQLFKLFPFLSQPTTTCIILYPFHRFHIYISSNAVKLIATYAYHLFYLPIQNQTNIFLI